MPDSTAPRARHRYAIYGLVVDSELALSSVERCSDPAAEAAVTIALGSPDDFRRRPASAKEPAGEDWIRHDVLADGSVYIRVEGVLEAIVAPDGRNVVSARLGGVDESTFEANLANFALSTCMTLRGEECLHATVVAFAGRTFGLLGPSGIGKSTLAAFLISQGARLVTDDILRTAFADGRVMAYPGPYRLKLFEEAAQRLLPGAASKGRFNALSRKIMIEPDRNPANPRRPLPLSALFWLGEPEPPPGSDVSLTRLSGLAALKALTGSAKDFRYFAPQRLARQMQFAERLARTLPIYALSYPRRYDLLDRVGEEIQRMLAT